MVCKEDVLSWFKDLEGYKRIDVLYHLLSMCLPFELRFLGSCIEELGKHSYQELWGPAIKANDYDKIAADHTLFSQAGLLDDKVRHRVLVYLSLLSSRNYSVANWLYKNVIRTEGTDNIFLVKSTQGTECSGSNSFCSFLMNDENVQSEFLLLFVMALHHPAFNLEHKLYFHKILSQLVDLENIKDTTTTLVKNNNNNNNIAQQQQQVYATYPPPPPQQPIYLPVAPKPMVPIEPNLAIPVKTALPIPQCIEEALISIPSHQHTIPGIPIIPPGSQPQIAPPEFTGMTKSRPLSCGAPEVPRPFPPPPSALSPQIPPAEPLSQQQPPVLSPIQSRTNSPHRTTATNIVNVPPMLRNPPPPQLELLTSQIPLELLSSSNNYTTIHFQAAVPPPPPPSGEPSLATKLIQQDEDQSHLQIPPPPILPPQQQKQHNGYRFPIPANLKTNNTSTNRQLLVDEQFSKLCLDGGAEGLKQQHTRSNSSSNSSLNQTPPETPASVTPVSSSSNVRNDKRIVNGMQQQSSPPPPPPSQQQFTFNNCSVPYSVPFAIPPRTFHQQQQQPPPPHPQYRPPFSFIYTPTAPPPTGATAVTVATGGDNTSIVHQSYMPSTFYYSNFGMRGAVSCCYNCGLTGHVGQECTGQNIEDIAQNYTLDYTSPQLPEK